MSKRSYSCSRCGQMGHNSRNRECRSNVGLRERENESMRSSITQLRNCETTNKMLIDLLARWQGAIPLEEFIMTSLLILEFVCNTYRIAIRHYTADSLLASIKENISKINTHLEAHQEQTPLATYSLGKLCLEEGPEGIRASYMSIYRGYPMGFPVPVGDIRFSVENIRFMINPRHKQHQHWSKITIQIQQQDQPQDQIQDCPVCLEALDPINIIRTNCDHEYCGNCIKRLASSTNDNNKQPTCPLCRSVLTELKIFNQDICDEIKTHISSL